MSKLSKKQLEGFIKSWNIKFPYDRLWRKKYNIPFGSEVHLKMSQIDIYLDLLEDSFILKTSKIYLDNKKDKDDYFKNGTILKEQKEELSEKQEKDLFDNFRKSNLQSSTE